jgi:galactokinase
VTLESDLLTLEELHQLHAGRYGQEPVFYRAPGRVNLVGEHTDYEDGYCMPAALNLSTLIAASPVAEETLRVYSVELRQEAEIGLRSLGEKGNSGWSDYLFGVARELQAAGVPVPGASLTLTGSVPIASGLSSSASIEVATAAALLRLAGAERTGTEIARLCQRAENRYVGAPCGIMDQFISANGVAGHALVLDCRTLTAVPTPIPEDVRLVICNSMVKHSVAGREYGKRRAEAAEGTRLMAERKPGVRALRDVTLEELNAARGAMSDLVFRRSRHIVTDSQRVLELAAALRQGKLALAGKIMIEAHASYRDDFDASCMECDLLVDLALALPGCYGSRLTGGGFGGCTVSLVDADQGDRFAAQLREQYRGLTGIDAQCFISEAAAGLHQEFL